jgi:hypothetical protein
MHIKLERGIFKFLLSSGAILYEVLKPRVNVGNKSKYLCIESCKYFYFILFYFW